MYAQNVFFFDDDVNLGVEFDGREVFVCCIILGKF